MEYTRLLASKGVIVFLKENNATRMDFIKNPSNGHDFHFELNNECRSAGTIDKRLQQDIRAEAQLNIDDVIVAIMTNQNGDVLYDLRYRAELESDTDTTEFDLIKTTDRLEGKYPEVYLSFYTDTCLTSYPPKPAEPVMPKLIGESSYSSEGLLPSAILWLVMGIFLIFCFAIVPDVEQSVGIFSLLFCFSISAYKFIKNSKKKEEFLKKIDKQNTSLLSQYKYEMAKYERIVENNKQPANVQQFRLQYMNEWIMNRRRPNLIPCASDDEVKKGPAEEFFANALKESYNVQTDMRIRINKSFYYPDIVIVTDGLYIDVEIDEPYSNDGTPIHYQEDNRDKARNEFFSENGWEVIRFSEKQVFNNTKECISFIGKYITTIQRCSSIISIDEAFIDPKCTRAEALSLAKLDYRSLYMPQSIRINKSIPNGNKTSQSSQDKDEEDKCLPF